MKLRDFLAFTAKSTSSTFMIVVLVIPRPRFLFGQPIHQSYVGKGVFMGDLELNFVYL